ncbi:MAG: hypothetical protein WCB53_06280 [Terriglobales bacterium]
MNLIGLFGTAVLSLSLFAAPVYAQEQHEQKEEQAKPAEGEKKAEPAKKAEQEKSAKPEEKGAQQKETNNKAEGKTAQEQHAQPAKTEQHAAGGRIPADRYKANFGREHTFHVSQAEYSGGRRFQYGGYWFGFVDAWPSNWLYTQDVFVVEINGMYYLCNASYPGVNIALNVTM